LPPCPPDPAAARRCGCGLAKVFWLFFSKKAQNFFFEKKKQKTFGGLARAGGHGARAVRGRVFGLDLARAVAILLVLVGHDVSAVGDWTGHRAPMWVSLAGPFGVELFFALSGLLIGGLLLESVARGADWAGVGVFLVRRWMRTLPLYYLWLAVLLVVATPARLGWHVLHYATLTQNLWHGMPADDFFAVSWSLTVEEWFYLLFALLGLGGVIVTGRRWMLPVMAVAFLVVPMALRWRVPDSADLINGLNQVAMLRLGSIAEGVLLACVVRRWRVPAWLALGLAPVGVYLIWLVWSFHFMVGAHVFRTFVMAVVGTGWLLCLPALLLWRQMGGVFGAAVRFVSQCSYGLYIVHYSLLTAAPAILPVAGAIVVGVGAPFLVAWGSWRWIEAPVLRRRPRHARDAPPASV
jgi:peptidoglycan/LPS O-acetylase OafA/YrhL